MTKVSGTMSLIPLLQGMRTLNHKEKDITVTATKALPLEKDVAVPHREIEDFITEGK